MKTIYSIVGINAPGRANVRLGGKFREVNLYDLSQEQLAELHQNGCKFVSVANVPESNATVTAPKEVEIRKPGKFEKPLKQKKK